MPNNEHVSEQFLDTTLNSRWQTMELGHGKTFVENKQLKCVVPAHDRSQYHNAQIDDYQGRARDDFLWQPPLEMSVQAWASHPIGKLKGTAGFGFWNHPFMPGGSIPRLPRAVWFFYASPESNIALAQGVPGYGWKAATFDAQTLSFGALLPLAPLGFLLMRIPALYRRLWPIGQQAIKVSEHILDVSFDHPHIYKLQWWPNKVQFYVDDVLAFESSQSPRGPLGFVAWLDNQYAVVTPQGHFSFGFVERKVEQSMTIESISIQPLATT